MELITCTGSLWCFVSAQGHYGAVYLGKYKMFDGSWKSVAIKTIKQPAKMRSEMFEKNKNDFRKEIELMVKLSHPHVVSIVGQVQRGEYSHPHVVSIVGQVLRGKLSHPHIVSIVGQVQRGKLSDPRVVSIVGQIQQGKHFAFARLFCFDDIDWTKIAQGQQSIAMCVL